MFAVFAVLLFLKQVSHGWIFLLSVLVATVIPDLDSKHSSYGRHLIFRPLQFFTKHRGILHSFTMAVIISSAIALLYPAAAFGFFLGYGVHLLCDSFTKEGIQPFWPLNMKSSGLLISGGRSDEILFFVMLFVNLLVFLAFFVWV
jgi:inner membrane protein